MYSSYPQLNLSRQTVTHRLVCVFVSPAVWDGPAVGDRSESSVC